MNIRLSHIFDTSSCLTGKQLKEYVNERMTPEERYAAEQHVNNCSLCSDAIEGLLSQPMQTRNAFEVNTAFIGSYLNSLPKEAGHPQYIDTSAPTHHRHQQAVRREKEPMQPNYLISAMVFVALAAFAYNQLNKAGGIGNLFQKMSEPMPAERALAARLPKAETLEPEQVKREHLRRPKPEIVKIQVKHTNNGTEEVVMNPTVNPVAANDSESKPVPAGTNPNLAAQMAMEERMKPAERMQETLKAVPPPPTVQNIEEKRNAPTTLSSQGIKPPVTPPVVRRDSNGHGNIAVQRQSSTKSNIIMDTIKSEAFRGRQEKETSQGNVNPPSEINSNQDMERRRSRDEE